MFYSVNFWFTFSSFYSNISLSLSLSLAHFFFYIKISFLSGHKNGEFFADMFVYMPCSWIPFSWISSKIKSNWCTSIKARIWLHKHTQRGTEKERKKNKYLFFYLVTKEIRALNRILIFFYPAASFFFPHHHRSIRCSFSPCLSLSPSSHSTTNTPIVFILVVDVVLLLNGANIVLVERQLHKHPSP